MAPKRSVVTPTGTISRFFAPKPKSGSEVSSAVQPEISVPPPLISVAQPAQVSEVATQSTQAEPTEFKTLTQFGERAARTGGNLSELQLGSKKFPLLCTCDAELATEWAQDVQSGIDTGLSTDVACVMGLDCEWAASWFRPGCPERLATLQLCHHGKGGLRVLVLHLVGFEGKLPEGILSLLADTRIAKVGAGVVGDARRLVRDFGCTVRGLYDLSSMDAGKKAVSLEDMVKAHCPSDLHITKASAIGEKGVRTSNWETWPLSAQQIDYCARDAALSVLAFVHRFCMVGENSLSESAREVLVNLKHAEVEETADVPMASEDAAPEGNAVPKAKAKLEAKGKAKAKAKSKAVDKETAGGVEETKGQEISATEATPSPKKRKVEGEVKTAKKTKTENPYAKGGSKNQAGRQDAKKEDDAKGVSTNQAAQDEAKGRSKNQAAREKEKQDDVDDQAAGDAKDGDGKKQKRVLTEEQKAHFFQCMRNKAISPPNIGVKEHPKGAKDALSKVVVIVSGILDSFERKDFEQYVRDHGGKVSSSVTAKVTHLVNDHGEAGPSKQAKCKEFGIPMVSEDVILKMVKDSLGA